MYSTLKTLSIALILAWYSLWVVSAKDIYQQTPSGNVVFPVAPNKTVETDESTDITTIDTEYGFILIQEIPRGFATNKLECEAYTKNIWDTTDDAGNQHIYMKKSPLSSYLPGFSCFEESKIISADNNLITRCVTHYKIFESAVYWVSACSNSTFSSNSWAKNKKRLERIFTKISFPNDQ